MEKVPSATKEIINNLSNIKIFPVFISDDFYKIKSQFDLSLAFNFDIIVPQEYLDNKPDPYFVAQ